MSEKIKAYAVSGPKQPFEVFEYDPGELRPEQIEIKVTHVGICDHLEAGKVRYRLVMENDF